MGKVKEFVKKHKDVVPYVIGAGIGLALLGVAGVKAKNRSTLEDLDHPELEEGKFNWYKKETSKIGTGHVGHIADVPVSDLGKVGDAMKQCDGIDENSKITFLFTDYQESK